VGTLDLRSEVLRSFMSNSWNNKTCNKKGKSEGEPFRGSSDRTYPCIWTFRLYKTI